MFNSIELDEYLSTSHVIENTQKVIAEWNLNQPDNIEKLGNYRYRPGTTDVDYSRIKGTYDDDSGTIKYYTGATDSDIAVDGVYLDDGTPTVYVSPKKNISMLYSLEDCIKPYRPRSGINKLLYLGIPGAAYGDNQYIDSLTHYNTQTEFLITDAVSDGTYITYTSNNNFKVGDIVKVTGISATTDGTARITISFGESQGSISDVSGTVYEGQEVVDGDLFPSGTYIVSIMSDQITFSENALTDGFAEVTNFHDTPSWFNILNPDNYPVVYVDETSFKIKYAVDSQTVYQSGGVASLGYLSTVNIARRPRYYMSSRYDQFKYWTSYRTEVDSTGTNNEYGISKNILGGLFYIDDAAPFVVYKEAIPTNRLVFKMQTNVGDEDLGPFRIGNVNNVPDPLFGNANSNTPKRWSVQILDNNDLSSTSNTWREIISFSDGTTRSDGSPVVKSDGYVEIQYGLVVPQGYAENFIFAETLYSSSLLPNNAPIGYTYLVKENDEDRGLMWYSNGAAWETFVPEYDWILGEETLSNSTNFVTKLSNPDFFVEDSQTIFRELNFIRGIRVVVETMNVKNVTFDLIEMSPRLVADVTEKVTGFSLTKTLSDLGSGAIPVGNLFASTGNVTIFDEDFAFNENNTIDPVTNLGSVINKYNQINIKFNFYDVVPDLSGYDYYTPIKTMYSQGIPQTTDSPVDISLDLRDFYFYLESQKAPTMMLTNVSLSYAITVLLDNIGFSNYIFKRLQNEKELIIPYFFIGSDQNVVEVLQQLALSSQSAMFFDEYNNFVVMSKGYMIPGQDDRKIDKVLYGQEEVVDSKNMLPNIVSIASSNKKVLNSGKINYTTRYIQRSIGTLSQAAYIDQYRTSSYKPVLLWEVAPQTQKQAVNDIASASSAYSLAAVPLSTELTSDLPQINEAGNLINNIIDLGEAAFWMANFSGYLYANGEVIKYDALEYSVQGVGNVWITDNHEYQDYFGKLKFNGKMYPTGRVRIYAEPKYEIVDGVPVFKTGEVKLHGRGQFGTTIVTHHAGLDDTNTWVSSSNVRGCIQSAQDYLFTMRDNIEYPVNMGVGDAGKDKNLGPGIGKYNANEYALKSSRNGIIKNFAANTTRTEAEVSRFTTLQSGSMQSSALVFNGPETINGLNPADFVSYAYKELGTPPLLPDQVQIPEAVFGRKRYTHFGTRMRIIGKMQSGTDSTQTANGSFSLLPTNNLTSTNPSASVGISGGSGGMGFNVNKDTNNGYFFEIVALNTDSINQYENNNSKVSYEILKSPIVTSVNDLVTVSTATQYSFNAGDTVSISGLVDDNLKSNTQTRFNGSFTVTGISSNRKVFTYRIDQANTFAATAITKAQRASNISTYTAPNSFKVGDVVKITGISTSFNKTSATITYADSTSFRISDTGSNETLNLSAGNSALAVRLITIVKAEQSSTDPTKKTEYVILESNMPAGQIVNVAGLTAAFNGDGLVIDSVSTKLIEKTVTGVSGDGTYVTYTTSGDHGFFAGQEVRVLDLQQDYNWESIKIYDTPTTNTFRIQSTVTTSVTDTSGKAVVSEYRAFISKVTSGVAADGSGTMEYVPLNSNSSSGGTASINIDDDFSINNVFFYKVVAGDNISTVIKKSRTTNVATLTTLKTHSFIIGDSVTISGVGSPFDGTVIITAITDNTISYTTSSSGTVAEADVSPVGYATGVDKIAIPQTLWKGFTEIIVDDGKFTGLSRMTSTQQNTVYDLSVEYVNIANFRRFYLYINDKQVAVIDDTSPLPEYNNSALFVRGSSKCMFENFYAIAENYDRNIRILQLPISKTVNRMDSNVGGNPIRHYSINDLIQKTYLSNINSQSNPPYDLYFEEFGTIMREAAYFNIKYDRSFPALYSKLAETANRVKTYTVSGFYSGSYGAEFIIFNCTDKTINLDDTSGNYLRILGIAFTQNTTYSLTIDDYLNKVGNLADQDIYDNVVASNVSNAKKIYDEVKNSRIKYGINEFSLDSVYLQTTAAAEDTMKWISTNGVNPKKVVGVSTFATQNLQLGDIVTLNYKNNDGLDIISDTDTRYVIYNIEHQKSDNDLLVTTYLVEV